MNNPIVLKKAQDAIQKLLQNFEPLMKKYMLIVQSGIWNWNDKESKDFVSNFINDIELRRALGRKKQTNYYKHKIYEAFNFVKETYGKTPIEEMYIDMQVLFMNVAKRYKQVGKNFCAYVRNSYKFELARHIKKCFKEPLNVTYKLHEYNTNTLRDNKMESYVDNYEESDTGIPTLDWINGACGEVFADFTPLERRILSKYYLENWNDRQIAENFGLHLNTINSKRRAAVKKLYEKCGVDISKKKRSRKSGKNVTVPQY